MKDVVIAVLSQPEVKKIEFSFGAVDVKPFSFQQVVNSVQSGKVKVKYSSKLPKGRAKYRYTHDTLFLGFRKTAKNADREALIVHECTHAAFDIAAKALLVKQDEAAAYIAQALYFYYKNEAELSKPGVTPKFSDDLKRAAWDVAMKARKNAKLAAKDVEPLLKEVAKHGLYKDKYDKDVPYDGV